MLTRLLLPLLFGSLLTGCATVLDRSTEPIRIESDPHGASVDVACVNGGAYSAVTPAEIPIRRDHGTCRVTLSKEGFVTQNVTLEHGLNRRILGNLLPFGLGVGSILIGAGDDGYEAMALILGTGAITAAGFVVDWATGRNDDHDPKRIRVTLPPAASP